MNELIEELLEDFYNTTSEIDLCLDGMLEYCESAVDTLHEILDEIVGYCEECFELEGSASSILRELCDIAEVGDYSEFYTEVKNISISARYDGASSADDYDFYDISERFEAMLNDFNSVDWENEDEDEDE